MILKQIWTVDYEIYVGGWGEDDDSYFYNDDMQHMKNAKTNKIHQ